MRAAPRTALVAAAALCVTGALVPSAEAAVTIGPTAIPQAINTQALQFPSQTLIFTSHSYPNIPLFAPMSGVITRWRLYTAWVSGGPTAQLRVLRPEGGVRYRVIRSAPPQVVSDVPNTWDAHVTPHEFPAQLPISVGEMVGVGLVHDSVQQLTVDLPAEDYTSPWAYGYIEPGPGDGEVGEATIDEQTTGPSSDQYLLMSADIEPDADGDGFGDETQDRCPTDRSTQGDCPAGPDTTDPRVSLSGVARSVSIKGFLRGIRVKVKPSEPVALNAQLLGTVRTARVSAFNLQLATRSAKLAAGPRTLRLKPRRALVGHPRKPFKVRLRIVATDAARNATIVTKTFRVRPRR